MCIDMLAVIGFVFLDFVGYLGLGENPRFGNRDDIIQ